MFALNARTNGVAFFLRRRNGKRLCVFAAATIVLICAYSFSSGGASDKAKASTNGAENKEHERRGVAALPGPPSNTATARSAGLREDFTALTQQLRQACAAQDSALLMRVALGFDSMAVRAPRAYDYEFWSAYIRQKRAEFIQSAPHDSARVAPEKKSPPQIAAFPGAQKSQTTAASVHAERKARAAHDKSAGPRRPANESSKIPAPALSEHEKTEAEQLYVQGYKIMAYKNRTAYLQALVLFKKAQEAAPDPKFKYHQKAGEKILALEQELAKRENE